MSVAAIDAPSSERVIQRPADISVGASWMNLIAAVFISTATHPGRVAGLGVITEPLLVDFQLTRTQFATINFWATMVVASMSWWFGSLADRLGLRRSYIYLGVLLAGSTALLPMATGWWTLFVAITVARFLGQGILALVGTSLFGKSFPRGAPMAAAVYLLVSAIVHAGMLQAKRLGLVNYQLSWQTVWYITAVCLFLSTFPLGLFAVTEPKVTRKDREAAGSKDKTLWEALRSPAFIVYGMCCLMAGMSTHGISLFNESLLKDRGFSKDVFFDSLMIGVVSMVGFKFVVAWLCQSWSMGKVIAIGMLLNAACLGTVQFLDTKTDVYVWSTVKALAFGIHVVVYFSIWVYAFGRSDLARIQGAAHMLTIFASGMGPLLFAICRDRYGSYLPVLHLFGIIYTILGLAMLFVTVPCAEQPREPVDEGKKYDD